MKTYIGPKWTYRMTPLASNTDAIMVESFLNLVKPKWNPQVGHSGQFSGNP